MNKTQKNEKSLFCHITGGDPDPAQSREYIVDDLLTVMKERGVDV